MTFGILAKSRKKFIAADATLLTYSAFQTRDMESKSHSHRLGQFKNKSTFKTDEVRRRREAQSVEIRKQKREDNLAKRRNLNAIGGKEDMSESEDEMEQAVDLQVRAITISKW